MGEEGGGGEGGKGDGRGGPQQVQRGAGRGWISAIQASQRGMREALSRRSPQTRQGAGMKIHAHDTAPPAAIFCAVEKVF